MSAALTRHRPGTKTFYFYVSLDISSSHTCTFLWPLSELQEMEQIVGEGEHVQVVHPGTGCIAGREQVSQPASLLLSAYAGG
jgi:hypothetical protein